MDFVCKLKNYLKGINMQLAEQFMVDVNSINDKLMEFGFSSNEHLATSIHHGVIVNTQCIGSHKLVVLQFDFTEQNMVFQFKDASLKRFLKYSIPLSKFLVMTPSMFTKAVNGLEEACNRLINATTEFKLATKDIRAKAKQDFVDLCTN